MKLFVSSVLLSAIMLISPYAVQAEYGRPLDQGHDALAEGFDLQASHCAKRGEYARAANLLIKAIDEEVLDHNDELKVARLYNDLGMLYKKVSADNVQINKLSELSQQILEKEICLQKAEHYLKESLRIKESNYKSGSTDFILIAVTLENLSQVYFDCNRLDECESCLRRAIEIRRGKEGLLSEGIAFDYLKIGDALRVNGHYSEAKENILKASDIYRKKFGALYPIVGLCEQRLAAVHYALAQKDQNIFITAGEHYDRAKMIYTKNLPETKSNLDDLNKTLGDIPTFAFTAAEAQYSEMAGKPLVRRRQILNNLAAAHARLGETQKAASLRKLAASLKT